MEKVPRVQRAFVLMNLIARSCRDCKKRNCHAARAQVDPVSVRGLRKRIGSLSARNAQYKRGCTSQHGQQLARRWGLSATCGDFANYLLTTLTQPAANCITTAARVPC